MSCWSSMRRFIRSRAGATVGLSPFAYFTAPWPRYVTAFDMVVNVAGYVPFGFLAVAALRPRVRGAGAFVLAAASAALLSLVLEAAQTYLPARFASNLDLLCNLAGAALGAALALSARAVRAPRGRCTGGGAQALSRRCRSRLRPGAARRCGFSSSSTRRRCCSAPATCATSWRRSKDAHDGRNSSSPSRPLPPPPTSSAVGLLLSVLVAPGWPARAMFGGAGDRRARGQERRIRDPDAGRERVCLADARRAARPRRRHRRGARRGGRCRAPRASPSPRCC